MVRRIRALTDWALLFMSASTLHAASLIVDTGVDSDAADGFCSLREAIVAANTDAAHQECPAGSGADRIGFALPIPATIAVVSDLPAITDTLAIRGPGAAELAIDGGGAFRLLRFDSASGDRWLLVEDLTLTRAGTETDGKGGALLVSPGETALLSRVVLKSNTSENGGGAIAVAGLFGVGGQLTLVDCELEDNATHGPASGGALLVIGPSTALVTGSAFVGNRSEHENGTGGAITLSSGGGLTIVRSTLSGNVANSSGGAIFITASSGPATLDIFDATLTANVAGAWLDTSGDGGGIAYNGVASMYLTLHNTIVAGNLDLGTFVDNPDLWLGGGTVVTLTGANLIGAADGAATSFPAGAPNVNGDFVGTAAAPIDPMLGALELHGGLTPNHGPILHPDSPVIDHGRCIGAESDQRGFGDALTHLRIVETPGVPNDPASDGCDIGAVERGATAGSETALFSDDFELGHSLLWSSETV